MKRYYGILDTRPKTQTEATALVAYYVTSNHIPRHRILTIKHDHRYKLVWKIYEKDLSRKRGPYFVYGDVGEYRKHLVISTAIAEGWLRRKK